MTYLYGDSTDSGLELNYIELLREFLNFAVQVMLSEHRVNSARAANEERKREMSSELDRLRELGATVAGALEGAKGHNPQSSTDQSIAALHRATDETLRRAAEGLKASVSQAEQQLASNCSRERAANAKLIERLLLDHELPDSSNTVDLMLNEAGTGYQAQVVGSCAQGLAWRFQAEINKGSSFAELVKVGTLRPEMSVDLPEMSGFVRKSVKLKPYKLAHLFVTALVHEGDSVVLKLRTSPLADEVTGLDIRFSSNPARVAIVRTQKDEESPEFQVPEGDAEPLRSLCHELMQNASSLVQERCKLLDVSFNKLPLRDCPDPSVLIERLVARIGPVIRGIAAHSLADTELVLKRVLANDRREEIFASKADLLDTMRSVPAALRNIFAPLGLGDVQSDVGDYDPTNRVDGTPMRAAPEVGSVVTSAVTPTPSPVATMTALDLGSMEVTGTVDISAALNGEEDDEATNVVDGPVTHEMTADAADELPPTPAPARILMPSPPKLPGQMATRVAPATVRAPAPAPVRAPAPATLRAQAPAAIRAPAPAAARVPAGNAPTLRAPVAAAPAAERISKVLQTPTAVSARENYSEEEDDHGTGSGSSASASLDSIDVALAELEADS